MNLVSELHIGPAITPMFWGLIRTSPDKFNMPQNEAEAENLAQQFGVLEQGLDGKSYVAGGDLTMGDIMIGVNVYRWYALDVKRPLLPRLEAYYERLKQRPPFQKHVMRLLS